jgi:hypothetical protein
MKKSDSIVWCCVGILFILAIACGGGGGGIASTSLGGTGTGGTKTKVNGSIDAFGSIYVGGIRFNTDNLEVNFEGASGNLNDLELGMWVEVEGTIDKTTLVGTATNLIYKTHQAGEIDLLNSDNTFQINSIVITTDARTFVSYDLPTRALSVGMDVSVTGTYLSNGNFKATYIGPNELETEFETLEEEFDFEFDEEFDVFSFLIELEEELESGIFEAEGLRFDFNSADDIFDSGGVEVGDFVSVTGELEGETLIVTQYALLDEEEFEEDDLEGEEEGELLDIDGSSLVVGDNTYTYNSFTYFEDDSNLEDRQFGPGNLEVGDFLVLYYRVGDQGQFILDYVIREDEEEVD